ncbi:MAG: hypothetical protein JRJ29_21480 [Deltaproteobacteria bacterium]|nr:hypothetical protein [Deltaproteobacteria bacterium]
MKTTDTQQIIKNELNDQNVRVACIRPAGENMIKIASIINEMRAVGRKGLGAVMGSKKLRAIAVRGTGKVEVADKEKLKVARDAFNKGMKESDVLFPHFSKMGTPMVVDATCKSRGQTYTFYKWNLAMRSIDLVFMVSAVTQAD